ncbi:MAG: vitamin K epoxide reductase family protein [Miltoncostaeaceae bacterium]
MKLTWDGEGRLRAALAVVSLLGLALAVYLTVIRFSGGDLACVVGGGCEVVQNSEYATLLGIPVPVLGILGYAGFLLAAALPGPPGRALGLFNGVVAVAFSGWLTYVEAFIIEAWCAWCVTSAVLVTIAALIAVARVVVGHRADGDGPGDDPEPLRS